MKATPAKMEEYQPKAIYEFVRALVIDPSLGGTQDAKKMTRHAHQHLRELSRRIGRARPAEAAGQSVAAASGELHHRERDQGAANRKQKEFESEVPAAGHVARHQEPARRRRAVRSTSRAR